MTGRKCAHVAACTASLGVLGGVCPITSRDSCSYYEPEIDRDRLIALSDDLTRTSTANGVILEGEAKTIARLIREAIGV